MTDLAGLELAEAIIEVEVAWPCANQLRDAYRVKDLTEGSKFAERMLESFATCPISEFRRLGNTLTQWKAAFMSYLSTVQSNSGGTNAVNRPIVLHRRVARGFRNCDNYRLHILLIAGGLNPPQIG
ncbi:transposase [Brevibacterium yomogidense]|uniref:Mobile element protein n=1 Tax=Brevibacterium yomogidense TaxID=946573 RepID=A0A1X6X2U4_9MICO|nr:transposase [Brevibacterium yomogidense]SLM92947.1 Mobile element protein [Brevibacterium yomogidense]